MRQRNLQRQAITLGHALFTDLKTRPGGTQVNERRLCCCDRFRIRCCKNRQNDIYTRDNAPPMVSEVEALISTYLAEREA